MVSIGEHVGLVGKIGTTRVYKIYARQPILLCNLLCSKVLFDGHWIVGAAFDASRVSAMPTLRVILQFVNIRAIIAQYHAIHALHGPNTGYNAPSRYVLTRIHVMPSQRAQL